VGAGLTLALSGGDSVVNVLSKGNVDVPPLLLLALTPLLAERFRDFTRACGQ
jgi:hypothetical protein